MSQSIAHLVIQYGYWMVAGLVSIESLGIPVPGETALIVAAAYAATTAKMNVYLVVLSAATGGVLGDNIGFWLGDRFGFSLLARYGRYVGMTEPRIKVGQYLFLRHGQRVVFIARFLPVLREIAAFLAGTNQMKWRSFLVANASGAALWASFYGFGAYALGQGASDAGTTLEVWIGVITFLIFGAVAIYLYRHEKRLEVAAERALPGPVQRSVSWRWQRPGES